MSFVVGVDIGGTFTDCVGVQRDRSDAAVVDGTRVFIGKARSTPPDFQTGFVDSLRALAEQADLPFDALIQKIEGLYHGCTVGTNALVERRTARTALLTTRGHRDQIFAMRAGQRLRGLPPVEIARVATQTKDEPLVPKSMCGEIDERVTVQGEVLVELNEETARAEIARLLEAGAEAIAVSLLWSVTNDVHERMLRRLIEEMAPGVFISLSSEVIRRTGEYERTVATVVNALIGPPMRSYLEALESQLASLGIRTPVEVMTCTGGVVDVQYAREFPVLTVGSGPVAGLIGAGALRRQIDDDLDGRVLTSDMGGTTFDVGVINNGRPLTRPTSKYGQYEYYVPSLDVRSVGAGGGSIIYYDESLATLKVGPRSAGSRPGPACYGTGGTDATVTDANLLLGLLNPEYFLGGKLALDTSAAARALERVGARIGFDAQETAAAALRIVDNAMADAIRLASVQQGYDPRECWMYAFGGGGPVHAAGIASELGLRGILVPMGDLAAGWSAFGIASADAIIAREAAVAMTAPFDSVELARLWSALEEEVMARLAQCRPGAADVRLERSVEMRYATQVNQVTVDTPGGRWDDAASTDLVGRFEAEYERLFGAGTGYPQAGFALTGLRVTGTAKTDETVIGVAESTTSGEPSLKGSRDVTWYELGRDAGPTPTPVYVGPTFRPGMSLRGPAIVEYPDTTVVVRPGNAASVDTLGNVRIEL